MNTIKVKDGRKQDFFIVENDIIRKYGAELGPYGLAVYCSLCLHADKEGNSYPSLKVLARIVGMSERQARAKVALLESLGIIRIGRRVDEDGRRTTSEYTVLSVPGVGARGAARAARGAGGTVHVVPGVGARGADKQYPLEQDPLGTRAKPTVLVAAVPADEPAPTRPAPLSVNGETPTVLAKPARRERPPDPWKPFNDAFLSRFGLPATVPNLKMAAKVKGVIGYHGFPVEVALDVWQALLDWVDERPRGRKLHAFNAHEMMGECCLDVYGLPDQEMAI